MPIICKYQRPNPPKRVFKPPAVRRIAGHVRMHGFREELVWAAVRSAHGMHQDAVARIYVAVLSKLASYVKGVLDTVGGLISLWRAFSTARHIILFFASVTPWTLATYLGIRVLFTIAKYAEHIIDLIIDLPDVLTPIIGEPTEDELIEASRRVDDIIANVAVFFDFNAS